MFESRVLRKIVGSMMEEITGDWRKLRTEELHYSYCSLDVIQVMKSRRMRWWGMWHVWGRRKMLTGSG